MRSSRGCAPPYLSLSTPRPGVGGLCGGVRGLVRTAVP